MIKLSNERLAELFGVTVENVIQYDGDVGLLDLFGTKRPPMMAWSLDALRSKPEPQWILPGWVPEGLSVVYARPKHGKSYWVMSLCVCYALGLCFFGHEMTGPGNVLYVAAEGGGKAVWNRINRFVFKLADCDPGRHVQMMADLHERLKVVTWGIHVDSADSVKDFLALNPGQFDVVVIDTLARNMDGDENLTADMNIMIQGCDFIRREAGARSVILVHHEGWTKARPRGAIALFAALDSLIHVVRKDGFNLVEVEELREAAIPDENVMTFRLNKAEGVLESVASAPKGVEKLRVRQSNMLNVLVRICEEAGGAVRVKAWREAVESAEPAVLEGDPETRKGRDARRSQWKRAFEYMKKVEAIKVTDDTVAPWRPADDFSIIEDETEDED